MWEYKSSRLNFRLDKSTDGSIAEDGDDVMGYVNAKIDGVASDLTTTQATSLINVFYDNLISASHYYNITKTLVVTEE